MDKKTVNQQIINGLASKGINIAEIELNHLEAFADIMYKAINAIQCCKPLKGIEAMQFEQWLCKYKFEKINDETYRKGRSDYDVKQLLKLYKMTH